MAIGDRYLLGDEFYAWGAGLPSGPVGVAKLLALDLNHPEASELEVQVIGASGANAAIEISKDSASPSAAGAIWLHIDGPDSTLIGAQPPVSRLLKGDTKLYVAATNATRLSAIVRLWGVRKS
jgi:hypothetical protein